MSVHIKLKYGNTNTFFIRGMSGNLLVDTDYAGTLSAFYRAIKDCKIKISDITYILATHYHPDHIGLVSELMNLHIAEQNGRIPFLNSRSSTSLCNPILIMIVAIPVMVNRSF